MSSPSDRPVAGILMMLVAMSGIGIVDAMGKRVMQGLPQLEVVGVYFFFIWLFSIAVSLARGAPLRRLVQTRALRLQVLRGLTLVSSLSMLFFALKFLPLAEATVLSFTSPLWIVAFSAFVLREKVGWRRWSAVVVGLGGAAIVMRPGSEIFQWLAVLPLVGAIFFALYTIVTRVIGGRDPFETTMFYSFGVAAAAVLAVAALTDWQWPTAWEWGQIMLMAALGCAGHFGMLQALAWADASLVAPFNYVRVLWAIGLGYLWFGAIPSAWTFAGGGVVIASGLYVLWRETRRRSSA